MSTDSCATCRFFVPGWRENPHDYGQCRYNAPVYDQKDAQTCWPRVWPEDWCGKHEPSIDSRDDGDRAPADGRHEVRYLDRPHATFGEGMGVVFGRSDSFEDAKTMARECRGGRHVYGIQIVDLQYQPPADQ